MDKTLAREHLARRLGKPHEEQVVTPDTLLQAEHLVDEIRSWIAVFGIHGDFTSEQHSLEAHTLVVSLVYAIYDCMVRWENGRTLIRFNGLQEAP